MTRPTVPRTPPGVRLVSLVFLLFCTLNLFDAWATTEIISHPAEELNPLMRFALERGNDLFFATKALVALAIGGALALASRRSAATWRIFVTSTAAFAAIAIFYGIQFLF